MRPTRVLVIGSSNVDFVMKVPVLPALGQTVTDGIFHRAFGGKGANQAVAAARAGAAVTFVTRLGHDEWAAKLRDHFGREGIDTRWISEDAEASTGTALVMIDDAGRNYLTVAPGSNHTLDPAELDGVADTLRDADAVVLQMEVPIDVNELALERAREAGVPVVFNYAPTRGLPLAVDARMSVLVVNENEAAELLGVATVTPADAAGAAASLAARGPGLVVVTLGADGVLALRRDGTDGKEEAVRVPAESVVAVDTTAAGDTFCGYLAVALAERQPLREALGLANRAAALATTVLGAQDSIPRRDAAGRGSDRGSGA